ncbi:kanadaptin-like isoform X1 [Corticium candelabrum]|uniref:kanadaptin-like isoform X1 n=1 Tax=Corticium candelabrum TaxID=121492 RepID=UPI002E2573CF|nr:kanadaptin-like isoform X1 [Corticium candelabrum]
MKFGGSTRLFILQSVGRQDDVERQAEEEIEEVRNERQKREEAREEERRQVEEMRARVIDEGVSWGMGDDDAEEEAQWQFQLGQSEPEIDEDAYYNRDPKKALNHYFEEEGMEVEYEVEEVGQGKDKKFHARIRLPIQTAEDDYIYGEATVAGKKKDAVVACALDACRILDAQGMLRATGAERRKKRERNWEENDFYDSDEDNFFDRTGHVEHKRQIRMMKAGKFQETVETFDSLSKQLAMLQKEIADYEEQLARNRLAASGAVDSLDDYMQHIDIIVDPSTVRKIKQKVSQLRKEELQLQRLVDIARPSSITEFMLDRDNTDAVENPKHTDGHGNMEMSKQSTHKEISSASSRNITVNPGWTKFDENKDIIDSLDGGDHDVTNRVPKENKSLADEITVDKPLDVDELEEDDGVEERVEAKRKKRREKRHRMKEKRRLSHGSTSDEERVSFFILWIYCPIAKIIISNVKCKMT